MTADACATPLTDDKGRYRARTTEEMREHIAKYTATDENGCWVWQRCIDDGYGSLWWVDESGTTHKKAHRVSYIVHVGPLSKGQPLDHLCRNRACVNPEHLEPVTVRENTLRSPVALAAINARKTHCAHGHEFTEENTGIRPKGQRWCRKCAREQERIRRERHKAND